MTKKEAFIAEIEREAKSTQKIFENIPEEKFGWKPHEKSMTLKSLCVHIANLSGMPGKVIQTAYLDFAEGGNKAPEINNKQDLIAFLNKGVQGALDALKQANESVLDDQWIMRHGDHIIIEAPKETVIQIMAMDHMIHHRGQLSVYLRLLDAPVPGMYGPSADDRNK